MQRGLRTVMHTRWKTPSTSSARGRRRRSKRPTSLSALVSRPHAAFLRVSGGRIRRSWLFAFGQPVLVLTTTGRRTGKRRSTVVAYFFDGDRFVTTASNLGNRRDPAWVSNLEAHPRASILVRGKSREVLARKAEGPERERLWARWEELQPPTKLMAAIAGREIPVIVLTPVSEGEPAPS
jgi:deazaflavin-dependent oxidoreductase (nitroreductase family)